MKKSLLSFRKYIALLVILSTGQIVYGEAAAQTREDSIKCRYVEKFTHFVSWQNNPANSDSVFRIAVVGDKRIFHALEETFKNVKVKDKNVKVNLITSSDQINNNLIVFISKSVNGDKRDEILKYTTGKPILTISERNGYGLKGVIINMVVVDNYVRYEINRVTLGKSRLKMNSLLIKSGTLVGKVGSND